MPASPKYEHAREHTRRQARPDHERQQRNRPAKQFAAQGEQVVITGRRDAVDDAVAQIGQGAIWLAGDVAGIAHHDKVAAEVVKHFGGLEIYMANVGVNTINPSSQVTQAKYEVQFNLNAKGVFFGVQLSGAYQAPL